ncbi:hypothetical protein QFC22_004272 [Naganishia vaughanmartiniae]|uniref:Uncharacterized protein n=2 Tax=Naganishia vaughanmartiniae TaxID=1424756 RepID=A0ACC2WFP2_9TREE|nr:hypothetical protein QFC22_006750 [Naganishia vaughanmartiniae]KAJ9117422.1 hypothetical protein QFC22_004272 [Naganishia vaughanmartiniae]
MACLEFTGTRLAESITLPFLQREINPLVRFARHLKRSKAVKASLYIMSSKAGSFTPWHVDAAGEAHWLSVVSGVKWVYLLPPTKHNVEIWRSAETGTIRADLIWLPDLCRTPVVKVELKEGEALLIPSGYLHAVFTVEDSLALAGAWISEFNMGCHMVLRGLEIVAKNRKDNGYPQFERQCWLIARYYAKKWSAPDFRIEITNPNSLRCAQHLYRQLDALLIFISAQTTKINARKVGWRKSVASLPWGWRKRGMIYGVTNDLRTGLKKVDAMLLEMENLLFEKRRV